MSMLEWNFRFEGTVINMHAMTDTSTIVITIPACLSDSVGTKLTSMQD